MEHIKKFQYYFYTSLIVLNRVTIDSNYMRKKTNLTISPWYKELPGYDNQNGHR